MNGKRTCIVLGAGASRAYDKGQVKLPLQKTFFKDVLGWAKANIAPFSTILTIPSAYPFLYFLKIKYDLPGSGDDLINQAIIKLDDINLGIEEMYNEIEKDYCDKKITDIDEASVLDSLNDILLSSLGLPIAETRNEKTKCCDYCSKLASILEPGDFIISFNYDSLIDDALLWNCQYWYPMSGYDIAFDHYHGSSIEGKEKPILSRIFLYHPHGSLLFKYAEEVHSKRGNYNYLLLLGLINGIQAVGINRMQHEIEGMKYTLKTMVVPPDSKKDKFKYYLKDQARKIQKRLKNIVEIVFIGYSFPENDRHLKRMFDCQKNKKLPKITIVNLDANDAPFRVRARKILPWAKDILFKNERFEEFIMTTKE